MGYEIENIKPNNTPVVFEGFDRSVSKSNIPSFAQLADDMLAMEAIIDKLCESKIVKDNFSTIVKVGNKEEPMVDRGDLMICLQMAQHLGIPPMVAIPMGRVFNQVGYLKAITGMALGFDPMISQTKFFGFKDADGNLQAGMYVATMQILAAKKGIILEYIQDDVPVKWYKTSSNQFLGTTFTENMILVPDANVLANYTPEQKAELQKKLNDPNMLGCVFGGTTRQTTIKASRVLNGKTVEIIRSYCLQEAIEANLAAGTKASGESVKGKNNWLNVGDMLSARCSGRVIKLIGADAFGGIALVDELNDSANLKAIG